MDYVVETMGLTRDFGAFQAVSDLGIQVERGSFYGFLGPNGAGKSTTIKILTGLLAPTAGRVQIFGKELVANGTYIKQRIGVVPEDLALFENLTAREYLTFIARMYRVSKASIQPRCEELLSLMGLEDTDKKLVLEFSHGMRKKLALAAALIHDPELLFLDEPFEGVDAIASRTIRTVLDRFVKQGFTIFITSHVLEIVEKLCTHIGIIRKSELISQGTLADLSRGGSLESAFVDVIGDTGEPAVQLSWLGGDAGNA